MNSLNDKILIDKLYEAASFGVKIDLIVRGICELKPGVPGLSENIRVISIVGRFLEHTRAFYFKNLDNPDVLCVSADWMRRNMFYRVEVAFPILKKKLRDQVIEELHFYLKDNCQAWHLQPDGHYIKQTPTKKAQPFAAQTHLLSCIAQRHS